jgi:hypothetical protein
VDTPPLPRYAAVDTWCALSGLSRRVTYDHLGLGNLKAIKVGNRTLIDVQAGLAWLRACPAPAIRAPKRRTRADAAVA